MLAHVLNTSFAVIQSNCGLNRYHERFTLAKRIVGGDLSKISEWPWLVSLHVLRVDKPKPSFKHICGGTLISTQWIMSAAHCFEWVTVCAEGGHPGSIGRFKKKCCVRFQQLTWEYKIKNIINLFWKLKTYTATNVYFFIYFIIYAHRFVHGKLKVSN